MKRSQPCRVPERAIPRRGSNSVEAGAEEKTGESNHHEESSMAAGGKEEG